MNHSANKTGIAICAPQARWDEVANNLRSKLKISVLRIRQPSELRQLKDNDIYGTLFFPHWSWLLPPHIFSKYECIMFHMTDLPFGRGGTPLQNLISRGITDTKISAFRCEAGVDAGPIYIKRPLSLEGSAYEILERASGTVESMIIELLERPRVPKPQVGDATYFERRTPEDSKINWEENLNSIYDHIRMLDDDYYPRAAFEVGNFVLEFTDARLDNQALTAEVTIRSIASHDEL